jgi:hypothetical protein
VGPDGRTVLIHDHQRLLITGKGDYQLGISAPVENVSADPGSQSQPGLRAGQILWAGFSPSRKVLAANVILRPGIAGQFLPVRVRLRRAGERVTLTVTNATSTAERLYAGVTHAAELAGLLDQARRASLAGARLPSAYATFYGPVHTPKQQASIEAPLRVTGELMLPGRAPVRFARTLGDGQPLSFRVTAAGTGKPKLRLEVVPSAVERLLRPPAGASSWRRAIRRHPPPASWLLRLLLESRMRLVRIDQYRSFLSNPDSSGGSRTVYDYETVAAPAPPPRTAPGGGGTSALLIVLVVLGSVAVAGGGLVLWAHS